MYFTGEIFKKIKAKEKPLILKMMLKYNIKYKEVKPDATRSQGTGFIIRVGEATKDEV